MFGRKITKEEMSQTLAAAEALHALAVHDVDVDVLESLIDHYSELLKKNPNNYAANHRWKVLIGLRSWRWLKSKSEVQHWY
jgi:hypothetical protein